MASVQCKGTLPWLTLSLSVLCLLAALGCNSTQQQSAAPDISAAEAAIRKTDGDWVKAAQSKQPDAWMAFYADDAVALPPNDRVATTREAIRKPVSELLSLPALSISWQPTKVEVARSGDLGYLYGTYQLSFNDPSGKTVSDTGKMVEIWKKQSDGSWKCIVDTWNSDLVPAPSAK